MSTTSKTLLSLPTEILHRIFDELDEKTILVSVQCTCKQLQLAAIAYNRFKLDWVPAQKLASVCQVLAAENVLSLCVLCDKNSFTSNDSASFIEYLPHFISLRSLKVYALSDTDLTILLNYLPSSQITELTLYPDAQQKHLKTESRLTTPSEQANESIKHCKVQRLSLNNYTRKQFAWIIRHFPDLQMLNTSGTGENEEKQTLQTCYIPMSYSNLTNLVLQCTDMNTDEFEILVSCMPSLVRLDLAGLMTSINRWFDGSFLEKVISGKLPRLKHLKYIFTTKPNNWDQLESVIAPFRKPFWYEEKRWFFSCTFSAWCPRVRLTLQSPPIEMTSLDECDGGRSFSLFNIPVSVHGRVTIDTMRCVTFDLDSMMIAANETKANYANYYYFSHPTHLSLYIGKTWSSNWLESLLSLMELVHLESLSLTLFYDKRGTSNSLLANIKILLDQSPNVNQFSMRSNGLNMNKICSIVPRRIKSLTLWVKTYHDMETILKQLDHLSTVTFRYEDDESRCASLERIIAWLIREKKTFTHKEVEGSLQIHFQRNNDPDRTQKLDAKKRSLICNLS